MKFTSSCALSIALGVSSAINSSAFISSSLSPPKTTNHRVQQLIHAHALIDADANINIDTAELEKSSWIKAFNMVDKDNSGFIDKQELKACLTALGQPNSDDDISRLLSPVGITLTDELKIDQESFLSIVGAGIDEELDNNQVLQMYHAIDIDASGYITAAELQHFLGNLGMFLDDQTMSGLMNMYDDDGNGRYVHHYIMQAIHIHKSFVLRLLIKDRPSVLCINILLLFKKQQDYLWRVPR